MNKLMKSFLALAMLVVCSTVCRAVWDSTTGNMPSLYQLCWGLNNSACIYGSTLTSNLVRIQTGGTDAITVNSTQQVGIQDTMTLTMPDASSTGTIINMATANTADIVQFQVASSTVGRVGPQGHVAYRSYLKSQVDTLVPDFLYAHITLTNHGITTWFPGGIVDCISTGTAVAQWEVAGGTHGVNMNGCGSGQ